MKTKTLFLSTVIAGMIVFASCRSHYEITGLERSRILIDEKYDNRDDAEATAFMTPYKHYVDSIMSPVVGRVAHYMYAEAPESPLSNLLPDILMWAGKQYGEHPEFGIYNIGGMRASLAEGDVTVGDILELAPFENKICFLTLKGTDVRELFEQIARQKGQGVSREIKLTIGKDGTLRKALIDGKDIDLQKDYRVVTIDYIAQGNDKMEAFKKKTDLNSPTDERNNIRYVIMDYLKERMAKGETVSQGIEGRITIVE